MLSLLVLILELIQALVREAVSIGLISHGHPAYIYDPLVQCNTSNSADDRNATGSSACNEGAGIALLVILGLICLAPYFGNIVIGLYFKKQLSYVSQQDEAKYSIEHYSPILSCYYNFFLKVEKKICCGGCTEQSATPSISSEASFWTYTLKSVAVTIYLFGKFLEPILHKYGECIDCDRDCVKILSHISTAALFLSTIMFHTFPHLMKKIAHWNNWEYEPTKEYSTLEVFSILLKAQSTYSSIVRVFRSTNYCSASEQAWEWILLVLSTAIAAAFVVEILCKRFSIPLCCPGCDKSCLKNYKKECLKNYKKECRNNYKKECLRVGKITILCLFLFIAFFLLLIGNSLQPLDCAFQCDILPVSSSKSQLSLFIPPPECCQALNNAIARIVIITIFIVLFVFLSFITFCALKRKPSEVTPQREQDNEVSD